jgi:predicted nucleic acid-binding protein
VGELHYGVGASTDPVEQLHRRQRLQLVLDTYDVLPFDADVAESYGLLAKMVRQAGPVDVLAGHDSLPPGKEFGGCATTSNM